MHHRCTVWLAFASFEQLKYVRADAIIMDVLNNHLHELVGGWYGLLAKTSQGERFITLVYYISSNLLLVFDRFCSCHPKIIWEFHESCNMNDSLVAYLITYTGTEYSTGPSLWAN